MGDALPEPSLEDVARDQLGAAIEAVDGQGELLELRSSLGLPEAALPAPRRPGRPTGSRNKRAESLVAQAEHLFGSPVLRALAVAMMPIEELAKRLDIKPMEALQEQRLWLSTVLPYVAKRQPVAVDLSVTGEVEVRTIPDASLEDRLRELMKRTGASFADSETGTGSAP